MQQLNTSVEEGADPRKYEVGRVLRFVGYDPNEEHIEEYERDHSDDPFRNRRPFFPGDLIAVLPANGCGMGIDVRGLLTNRSDGISDMVWPTEVEVPAPRGQRVGRPLSDSQLEEVFRDLKAGT